MTTNKKFDEHFDSFFYKVVNGMADKESAQKVQANKDVIKVFWREAMWRGFGIGK